MTVVVAGSESDPAARLTIRSVRACEYGGDVRLLTADATGDPADQAGSDYLIQLGPGTILHPGFLVRLVERAESTGAAVVVPQWQAAGGGPVAPSAFVSPGVGSHHHAPSLSAIRYPFDVPPVASFLSRTASLRDLGGLPSDPQQADVAARRLAEDGPIVLAEDAVGWLPDMPPDLRRRPRYDLVADPVAGPAAPNPGPDILIVTDHLPNRNHTGKEARRCDLVDDLAAAGAHVVVWAERGGDEGADERRPGNGAGWVTPAQHRRWRPRPDGGPFALLDDVLGRYRWDHIIVTEPRLVGPVADRAGATPVVADLGSVRLPMLYDPDREPDPDEPAMAAILAELEHADGVIGAGTPEVEFLRRLDPDRATTVFTPSPVPGSGNGPRPDGPLLFIGDLLHHPNLQAVEWWLEELAGRVAARAGRPIPLRVVGRGSELYRQVWPHPEKVDVVGPVPDLSAELAACRMLLVPLPYATGTGGRVIRALAGGVPVAATAYVAGLVPPHLVSLINVGRDAEELADVTARLMTDDAAWTAARRTIEQAPRSDPDDLVAWLSSVTARRRPVSRTSSSRREPRLRRRAF
ncbi:MAG: glycosyltransferase family 4 protein [Acidimicrobiia bacterium]|nr:glycosyltransferase family 4 protein [Acidimicrobiia bacterium]